MKKTYLLLLGLLVFTICNAQYVTLYTPNGSPIETFVRDELSNENINRITEEYRTAFSDAEVLAPASNTYNCHSYAWNLSAGGTQYVWMNQSKDNSQPNIQQYWSDESYIETTEVNAEKIFYYSGDHSAIKASSSYPGKYQSKWGSAPLMRHNPTDVPSLYSANYRKYYASSISQVNISGTDLICTSNSTFSLNNLPPNTSVLWTSSSNISFPSGNTGSSVSARASSSTASGSGWLEATLTTSNGSVTLPRKDVWVGVPKHLYMHQTFENNYDAVCAGKTVGIKIVSSSELMYNNIDEFTWDMGNWSSYFFTHGSSTNKSSAWFNLASSAPGSYNVLHVTASNTCGDSYPVSMGYYVSSCGSGWYMQTSPNPANAYAEINFYNENEISKYQKSSPTMLSVPLNEQTQELGEYEIQIWHQQKGLVKKIKSRDKKLQIKTNNLDEELYFLHVIINGQVYKQKLKVER